MKKSHKYVLVGVLLAVGLVTFFMFTFGGGAATVNYDEFAMCVRDSGAVMYGAYWCPHCQSQKEMFGDSWDYITSVECDPRGNNAEPAKCSANGITGYPTWIFGDGQKISGALPLSAIASFTGCELP